MQVEHDRSDAEEVVCRICRLEAEPNNPLFHPCKCSGTIKFVHQDCLNQWLKHSGHTHCEVCKHKFSYTPLYAPDAPPQLPWLELVWGLGRRSFSGIRIALRVLLVVFVWLSVVPLSTCWLWRLGFTRSLSEALLTLKSRINPVLVFADCVQGSLISSVLIFLVLFVGYVWEQVRLYWSMRQAELQHERERPPVLRQPQAPPLRLVDRLRQQQQQQQQAPTHLDAPSSSSNSSQSEALPAASTAGSLQPDRPFESSAVISPVLKAEAHRNHLSAKARQAESQRLSHMTPGSRQQPGFGPPQQLDISAPSNIQQQDVQRPQMPAASAAAAAAHVLEGIPQPAVPLSDAVQQQDQAQQLGSALMVFEQARVRANEAATAHGAQQAASTHSCQSGLDTSERWQRTPSQQHGQVGAPVNEPHAQFATAVEPEQQEAAAGPMPVLPQHQALVEALPQQQPTVPQQQAAAPAQQALRPQQQAGLLQQQAVVPEQQPEVSVQQEGMPQPQVVVPEQEAVVPEQQAAVPEHQGLVQEQQALLPQHQAIVPEQHALVPRQRVLLPQRRAPAPQQREAAVLVNDEPMAFEELVGLRGPIRLLFENAGTVIFSSAMFMAATLWAPFTWGRITIRGIVTLQAAWKLTVLPAAAMQLLLKSYQDSNMQTTLLPNQGSTLGNHLQDHSALIDQSLPTNTATAGNVTAQVITLERLAQELQQHLAGPDLSDWLCLAVGYLSLTCVALTAAWLVVSWKVVWQHWRPRLLAQHGVLHLMHRLMQDVYTKLITSAGLVAVMAKVMLVLGMELACLPVAYGFWLDICALPLFEGSLMQRLALLRSAPVTWTLLHWMIGMACLMVTAAFLSVVRSVLRPGALPWLKDPFDPEGEPLQQVLSSGIFLQLGRELMSLAAMSCLAVILVHLPIRLATAVAPSLFPFSFHPLDTVTEVPADMLLLHVCLPFTLPHLHIRQWSKASLAWWLQSVARPLEVDHYLLPPPRPAQQPPQHPPQTPQVRVDQQQRALAPQHVEQQLPSASSDAKDEARSSLSAASPKTSRAAGTDDTQADPGEDVPSDTLPVLGSMQTDHVEGRHSPRLGRHATADRTDDLVANSLQQQMSEQQDLFEKGQEHSLCSQHATPSNASLREEAPAAQHQTSSSLQPLSQSEQPSGSTSTNRREDIHGVAQLPGLFEGARGPSAADAASPSGTGQEAMQPTAVQIAPATRPDEAAATANGLVSTSQLGDSEDLASQLMVVGLLLMLTLLLLVTGMLTLPCIIGRAVLKALHAPLRHDLYCAVLGGYVIWGAATAAVGVQRLVQRTSGGRAMIRELQGWVTASVRVGALAFLTLIVIPFLAGLYLDLVMLPFRVGAAESPVIFIYQDWACGVLLTKICYKIVTCEGNLPQSLSKWRDRVRLVQRFGVLQVPFSVAFKELLWPVMKPLVFVLALPYAITRGVVPFLGMSAVEMQTLYVHGFALEYAVVLMYYCLQHIDAGLHRLHNSIRDDRYLVGRQLNNFLSSHI